MLIPHEQLVPATLRAVVLEFVTRDGTDHSSVETRVEEVLNQLQMGCVRLHFDEGNKLMQHSAKRRRARTTIFCLEYLMPNQTVMVDGIAAPPLTLRHGLERGSDAATH